MDQALASGHPLGSLIGLVGATVVTLLTSTQAHSAETCEGLMARTQAPVQAQLQSQAIEQDQAQSAAVVRRQQKALEERREQERLREEEALRHEMELIEKLNVEIKELERRESKVSGFRKWNQNYETAAMVDRRLNGTALQLMLIRGETEVPFKKLKSLFSRVETAATNIKIDEVLIEGISKKLAEGKIGAESAAVEISILRQSIQENTLTIRKSFDDYEVPQRLLNEIIKDNGVQDVNQIVAESSDVSPSVVNESVNSVLAIDAAVQQAAQTVAPSIASNASPTSAAASSLAAIAPQANANFNPAAATARLVDAAKTLRRRLNGELDNAALALKITKAREIAGTDFMRKRLTLDEIAEIHAKDAATTEARTEKAKKEYWEQFRLAISLTLISPEIREMAVNFISKVPVKLQQPLSAVFNVAYDTNLRRRHLGSILEIMRVPQDAYKINGQFRVELLKELNAKQRNDELMITFVRLVGTSRYWEEMKTEAKVLAEGNDSTPKSAIWAEFLKRMEKAEAAGIASPDLAFFDSTPHYVVSGLAIRAAAAYMAVAHGPDAVQGVWSFFGSFF